MSATTSQADIVGPVGGGPVSVTIPISIDATGADAAELAGVQGQIAELRASLPGTIVATVARAKQTSALVRIPALLVPNRSMRP
jgi:hypothetical protein